MQQASGAYQKERLVSYIGSIGAGPGQQKKRRYEQEPEAINYFGTVWNTQYGKMMFWVCMDMYCLLKIVCSDFDKSMNVVRRRNQLETSRPLKGLQKLRLTILTCA